MSHQKILSDQRLEKTPKRSIQSHSMFYCSSLSSKLLDSGCTDHEEERRAETSHNNREGIACRPGECASPSTHSRPARATGRDAQAGVCRAILRIAI
jgi:hypothetical protein